MSCYYRFIKPFIPCLTQGVQTFKLIETIPLFRIPIFPGIRTSSWRHLCLLLALVVLHFVPFTLSHADEGESSKWTGVDERVVEKIAADHGRPAKEPLINTDQGDLLLFVFLGAGALGGFAAGYYWHKLISSGPKPAEALMEKQD